MEKLSIWTKMFLTLCVIGAINWGLVGFFNWNLVNAIFGGSSQTDSSILSRIIYSLVGLAGLGMVAFWPRLREAVGGRAAIGRRAEVRP